MRSDGSVCFCGSSLAALDALQLIELPMPLCSKARAEEWSRLTPRRMGNAGLELRVCLRWGALAHGTSGRTTFQQKPREVFGDSVGAELRPGHGKELQGLATGGCGCSLCVCRHRTGPGEAPHEGSKRSQHGCAKPDSFVNTE